MVEEPGGAGSRARLGPWLVALLVVLLLAFAAWSYLQRRGVAGSKADRAVARLQDMKRPSPHRRRVRKAPPVASDGRIDVYALLRGLDNPREEIVRFCFSARAGKGPSAAEFEAGDYTNFPYQQFFRENPGQE